MPCGLNGRRVQGLRVQPTASMAPPRADLSISVRRKPHLRGDNGPAQIRTAGRRVAHPRGPTVCKETPGTQAGSCTPSFPKRTPTDSLRSADGPWLLPEHPALRRPYPDTEVTSRFSHPQTWRTGHQAPTSTTWARPPRPHLRQRHQPQPLTHWHILVPTGTLGVPGRGERWTRRRQTAELQS